MKLLMNYIYQYENNLEIILKQDWFMPDLITSITCKRKGNYLWGKTIQINIFNEEGLNTIIELELKKYGITDKFIRKNYVLKFNNCRENLIFKVEKLGDYWFSILCNNKESKFIKQYYLPIYNSNIAYLYNSVFEICKKMTSTLLPCAETKIIY